MLSIKSIGAAESDVAEYYEQLAQDDYYQIGLEPAGRWYGDLTGELELYGEVKSGQLGAMFKGCHPLTAEELTSNSGPQHKAGWDLTFSAPKSVSVVWAVADAQEREQIATAHDAAVIAAMNYLQKKAFSSRDRHRGDRVDRILAATFQHGSSRELDPQLHSHVLVANLAARGDGTFCAIDFDSRYKMAAGAVYRAELASRLFQAGYRVERDGKSFRLNGVGRSICDQFSKRRNQILERLQVSGHAGAKAAGVAALATRQTKVAVARSGLHDAWSQEAEALGLTDAELKRIKHQAQSIPAAGVDIDSILSTLTASSSTFTVMQLEAEIATEAQGQFSALQLEKLIEDTVKERLADSSKLGLVELRDHGERQRRSTTRYTTREILDLERGALTDAASRQNEARHSVRCAQTLADFPSLSEEQLTALMHITEKAGAVKVVQGLAGTGKSYLLKAAKESWERAGYTVLGAALSGKAADSLEQGSGIASQTLHSLLTELDTEQRTLKSTDIVVLDEAAMIGSRQMARLLTYVHAAGAKTVLVGDSMQLQPIDAGGIFRALSEKLGHAKLKHIRRQEMQADRQMVHDVIAGQTGAVLTSLKDRGMLQVHPGADVCEQMVEMWDQLRDAQNPAETVMLAGTRVDVRKLNQLARERLKAQSRLRSEITVSTEAGERQFAVGDRVVFTRNSRWVGVKNGQTGSLVDWQVDARGDIQLTVQVDSSRKVNFAIGKYNHLDHGYALSVHKAQGQTLDNALVMLSESMTDREWAYVATSRHRKHLRVFIDEEHMDSLESMLGRSRQKDISLDYQALDSVVTAEIEA
jgi:Ti-type conjugative transfer relaxase TraA